MNQEELVSKIVMWRTELERQNASMGVKSVFDSICTYLGGQSREIKEVRDYLKIKQDQVWALDEERKQLRKYIGFLQSCVQSGAIWEGNFEDFIKCSEQEVKS